MSNSQRQGVITLIGKQAEPQPRSQGLSSLPPSVVGRKTLVAAGHVQAVTQTFPPG